jgi:hypothetical protein
VASSRFQRLIEEGRADGVIAAKGRIYRKGIINGEFASLQLYLANTAGWVVKPAVSVVTNVVQQNTDTRTPEQVKAHLVDLQRAVLEECRRFDEQQPQQQKLPPVAGS